MELQKAKIIKVLSTEGIPKHINMWMREVTYYRNDIIKGYSAVLFYAEDVSMATSYIQNIREDENNLVLTTANSSVYYIKKFS